MTHKQTDTEGQHLMKSNKSYSFISRFIILFFVAVALSWMTWLWWKNSVAPVDVKDTIPVAFTVESGDGAKIIAANLYEKNLIRSSTGFYVLVKILGIEKSLQAGEFRLTRAMDSREIAVELTHGISDQWITTLEGWRSEEVAAQVARELDLPEQEVLKYAKEGYMFPDTYLVPQDASPAGIVAMFKENFEKKVTPQMREDAKKTGLTLPEVVILASIVEREGHTLEDRPVIAGILLNRLKINMPLQTDATLQYAIGYQVKEKTWWKKTLYDEDKKVKSLYNTYEHTGLPPGPISNPGIEAIKAVIYSTPSDYLYYLHDPQGGVHYAETLDEHNANVNQYLR
jgi:UPF0755 protein